MTVKNNKENNLAANKKRKKIQVRLIRSVNLLVIISFIIVAIGSSLFFYQNYKEQIILDEQEKQKLASQQIASIQSSIVTMAKQIAVDSRLQEYLENNSDLTTFEVLVNKDGIKTILKTYAIMSPYLESISIYDGKQNYSTNTTYGDVDVESERWYQEFKSHGSSDGYTEQHINTLENGLKSKPVISYILTIRKITNGKEKLGDVIMNLDYSYMLKKFTLDQSMLAGFAIFDEWGNTVYTDGDLTLSYQEILEENNKALLDNGNVLLINDTIESGWVMVSEISKKAIFERISFVFYYFLIVCIAVTIILNLIMRRRIQSITNPIKDLHHAATEIGKGNFDVFVEVTTQDELEELGNTLNTMVQNLQVLMKETVEYERITKEMEINRLMLQINPHFIYNTLNSIVYMAQMDHNTQIAKFANAFIALLQNTLSVDKDSVFVRLGQELKNVKNYLILQEYRYPNKFDTEIICEEELFDCAVPNVFIQPIVENSIFHGLAPKSEKGLLKIRIERMQEDLKVIIEDNGLGMSEENVKRLLDDDKAISGQMRTIGVSNVRKRILHIYGESYGMEIWSKKEEGTRVVLRIPYRKYEI